MKRTFIALLAVLAVFSVGVGTLQADDDVRRVTAPSDDLVKKLTETVRKFCPNAKIEVTKEAFIAKHATMMFTVHGQSMDGEFSAVAEEEEGPTFKGFILEVSLEDGPYGGKAGIPQTLRQPYWQRFIDGPATDDGKKHFSINFSYGGGLDPKLQQAIFDALPKWPDEGEDVPATTPPDELVKTLTETIRKHCPEAKIEVTKEGFLAKDGTMMFTVHGQSKTGEVSRETGQEEGPNYKGFLLRVSLEEGTYAGAAVIPQTLQGPYFPTFIDGPATDDGKNYHRISFSYGSRLDPKLKQAILEAIPKTKFGLPDPSK